MSTSVDKAPSLLSVSQTTGRMLGTAPLHFLLLQIPEGSLEIAQLFIDKLSDKSSWLGLVFVLPYFCVASALSSALTYISIVGIETGSRPTLSHAVAQVKNRFAPLALTSLLAGFVTFLGFAALLLPGIYFITIFAFVPFLVMSEPRSPASNYLFQSKKVAKQHFGRTLLIALVLVGSGIVSFFVSESLVGAVTSLVAIPIVQQTLSISLKIGLAMLMGAVVDTWLAIYFIKLKALVKS